MVHVRTVRSTFHAQLIAARLGADGVLTELRGNVGGPYPIGETSVWVPADEADTARALLLADEMEAPAGGGGEAGARARRARRVAAGAGLIAVAMGAVAAHLGL
jgi:hypothetical protein